MNDAVSHALVEAFYRAYAELDMKTLAGFLDDKVEWSISGPVDLLHFCGKHCGKADVLDMISRRVPEVFRSRQFSTEAQLIDGDRVSTLTRFTGISSDSNRRISYRVANFMRFRNNKIYEYISIIDSFDAVEQVLGHSIAVNECLPENQGDLVAL